MWGEGLLVRQVVRRVTWNGSAAGPASRTPAALRPLLVAVVLSGLLAVLAGCGGGSTRRAVSAPPDPAATTQPAGQSFYVWDQASAARQLALARSQGHSAALAALARLAAQPTALWLSGAQARGKAEELTSKSAAAGRTALIVAYDIPHRDCGQFSAGGAVGPAEYRQWVDELASELADRAAWVVLEPDAVAHTVDGCGVRGAKAAERYELLSYAITELKKHPQVRVYLDAGNAGWLKDPAALIDALRRSGVGAADGFAVNVANFYTTAQSLSFGDALSAALGGKHFVVDTSRNGNGPLSDDAWCNPPGRALGEAPTVRTADPLADAYLWVKTPGESDGDCGRGEPKAGEFWLPYALALAGGHP